ncbi:conserved hypothetical protein [Gluconacetobacter diazotrophicus PA1 5]|uniref:Uncharacterized protein n=1 Tax=Gluconacetobacter diazotrophicus (strain ATCC 49037 / DSM 5601 / CCUG 37298 / CIP 103539 / LMG 7603 / PAl5) TaxID=272568 RepID=A9HJ53_GLUDA|nr:conserved hypothetical protein [Gluconacetobacter diazotrophicus PA1 5]
MLGMLEIGFRHDAIARSAGITAKLKIFFEQLLGRPANTQVGTIAVEHMVPVERDLAVLLAYTAAIAAARAMVSAPHAFHVHKLSQHFPVNGRHWSAAAGTTSPLLSSWVPGHPPGM